MNAVFCTFENDTCGFLDTHDWTLEANSDGQHERFENTVADSTDLRSPSLCRGEVHVTFSSQITPLPGQHAQLNVLTECDDEDLLGQPTQGLVGPVTSWGVFTFILPSCPADQSQRVVFRVVKASPGSVFLLDNVRLLAGCNKQLECYFDKSTCGFEGSSDWTLAAADTGRVQRFENVVGDSTDLRSPVLCSGVVSVQLRAHVTPLTAVHAQLTVLTECDDEDLWGQPLQAVRGPTGTWAAYNFTLPACPVGQTQRLVFRAVRATPGIVFHLDNIIVNIESK